MNPVHTRQNFILFPFVRVRTTGQKQKILYTKAARTRNTGGVQNKGHSFDGFFPILRILTPNFQGLVTVHIETVP